MEREGGGGAENAEHRRIYGLCEANMEETTTPEIPLDPDSNWGHKRLRSCNLPELVDLGLQGRTLQHH